MKNTIASLTVAASLLATPLAQAQTCSEQLTECESLLKSADYVIDQQAQTIQMLTDQNYRLERELAYAMTELSREKAWYSDTSIIAPLTFAIGLVAGAYTMKQLK